MGGGCPESSLVSPAAAKGQGLRLVMTPVPAQLLWLIVAQPHHSWEAGNPKKHCTLDNSPRPKQCPQQPITIKSGSLNVHHAHTNLISQKISFHPHDNQGLDLGHWTSTAQLCACVY